MCGRRFWNENEERTIRRVKKSNQSLNDSPIADASTVRLAIAGTICLMRRVKKAFLLPLRGLAYRRGYLRLYYWADRELYALNNVMVMPEFYYRWLYRISMRLLRFDRLRRFANRAIHTIPYHIRFHIA